MEKKSRLQTYIAYKAASTPTDSAKINGTEKKRNPNILSIQITLSKSKKSEREKKYMKKKRLF
jgi:hypothetical protein